MSILVRIKRAFDSDLQQHYTVKEITFPASYMTEPDDALDDARRMGENVMGWIEEFDGDDIDIIIEVRPDPADQRTIKDGELR